MKKKYEGIRYIAIDGVDGVGKTGIVEKLENKVRNSISCALPYKNKKLKKSGGNWAAYRKNNELLLKDVVRPALKKNKFVIQDRSFVSTFVYQQKLFIPSVIPDMIVILTDVPELIYQRNCQRYTTGFNSKEEKEFDFINQIQERYKEFYYNNVKNELFDLFFVDVAAYRSLYDCEYEDVVKRIQQFFI